MNRGRVAAFEDLYERYGRGLYHYLVGQVRRVEVAEDLLQTVMLRVVRHRRDLRRLENPRAWLFRIARNELSRQYRRAGRRGAEAGDAPLEFVAAAGHEGGEDLDALRSALERLSPERWEVVSLKAYQGLTFREIGEVLDVSPNTAASRYRYALSDLRRMLERVHDR